jgi:hypothetical protein
MLYKIDYLLRDKIIIVNISGVFSVDSFVETIKEIVSGTDYPSNIDAIYELTHMSFDNITSDYLHLVKNQVKKYGHKREGAKTAYVCPNDLQFGMIRIWEVFVNSIPIETMVTRSIDEALEWIKR